MVLRLPKGHRFTAMRVSCSRVIVEYSQIGNPEVPLQDALELQVPVRESEAVHALRHENGEEILSLWIPRHQASQPGNDVMARQPTAAALGLCQVAS